MEAMQKALDYFGSLYKMGKAIGATQTACYKWAHHKARLSAEWAVLIERASDGAIKREELRPDIFIR